MEGWEWEEEELLERVFESVCCSVEFESRDEDMFFSSDESEPPAAAAMGRPISVAEEVRRAFVLELWCVARLNIWGMRARERADAPPLPSGG